jgi:outer membrane protein
MTARGWCVRAAFSSLRRSTLTLSIGGDVDIDNSVVPEVDVTYFLSENFAIEAIAAVTPHDVAHSTLAWILAAPGFCRRQ